MSETCFENTAAFAAFSDQLRTLCLKEFPCGLGSWIENSFELLPYGTNTENNKTIQPCETRFPITLKDYGSQFEKTETLEEYVKSKFSPWHLDYSWSNEARELREIAVKSPWLIDDRFVFKFFKTIRIVDKNVTEIDKGFLKFKNLKELTLSANYLESVNSRNLPRNLSVLELCANRISNLSSLCEKPPKLHHLGLGYNRIFFIDDYITEEIWPNLLSLDLGRNNLSNLIEIVRQLSALPKLRNLVLQGNPLALIAGYRGYIIDSLRNLSILDDIRISADEKHHYKGLSKRKEHILDEAKVRFAVNLLKGVPMPEELKNPDEQPEFPIVTKKYFVQFMFLKDNSGKGVVLDIQDEVSDENDLTQRSDDTEAAEVEVCEAHSSAVADSNAIVEKLSHGKSLQSLDMRSVSFAQSVENIEDIPLEISFPDIGEVGSEKTNNSDKNVEEGNKQTFTLEPLRSEAIQWSEEMEINWWKNVTVDNLLGLRDFLLEGISISVMEEKIQAFPLEQEEQSTDRTGSIKSKSKDDKDKRHSKDKGKDDKTKGAKDDKKDDKKKKKKGEPEVELKYLPSEYTTLATFQMPLADILDGEFELKQIFTHEEELGVDNKSETTENKSDKRGKDKRKRSSAKLKKDTKESKTAKSPSGKPKDEKKKGKDKGATEEEEEPLPPPNLQIAVSIKIHHWETAMDSVRADNEHQGTEANQGLSDAA